jgi:hypothetical protein
VFQGIAVFKPPGAKTRPFCGGFFALKSSLFYHFKKGAGDDH